MTEVVVTENKGLTKDSVATNVAINKAPVVAETPTAGFSLRSLSFTDASNYFMRFMSSTIAQNTADSKGNVRYVDNRYRSVGVRWLAGTAAQTRPVRQICTGPVQLGPAAHSTLKVPLQSVTPMATATTTIAIIC